MGKIICLILKIMSFELLNGFIKIFKVLHNSKLLNMQTKNKVIGYGSFLLHTFCQIVKIAQETF